MAKYPIYNATKSGFESIEKEIDSGIDYINKQISELANNASKMTQEQLEKAKNKITKQINKLIEKIKKKFQKQQENANTKKEKLQWLQNLISKQLTKLAKHYKCNLFSIEDLNIKNSNKELGKKFNKLTNNLWCRNILEQNIQKRCNFIGIKLIKVLPNYSSFIGNLVYRELKLPDMILSSIEISRRSYEFYHQYIKKDKLQEKNIVWPKLELVKNKII